MDYRAKDIYSWGIFSAEVYSRSSISIQRTVRMSWISTNSEPMGLCITSIVKTLADNHTLVDRNHQGHHTTLLLSKTLLSTARGRQRAVCDNQHRAICPGAWQVLDSTWSTERGCQGPPVVPAGWCHHSHLKRIIGMAAAAFPWPTD